MNPSKSRTNSQKQNDPPEETAGHFRSKSVKDNQDQPGKVVLRRGIALQEVI
jgi:hypothetical protein